MEQLVYLVVGLGKTGCSIARYLKRNNKDFIVYDTRDTVSNLEQFRSDFQGVEVFLGHLPDDIYTKILALIVSPGVDLEISEIQKAVELKIPIFGDIECFAKEVSSPVIAITGTNGKSTVTTLVGKMAEYFDIEVGVAGNIGTPVLDLLKDSQQYGLWVLELSSFQLNLTYSLAPIVSTILNVTNDHLDRHKTLENYTLAKQRVYNNSKYVVYNRDDLATIPNNIAEHEKEFITSYGMDEPNNGDWGLRKFNNSIYLAHGNELIISVDSLKIKGRHNWINALAACSLAYFAGISYAAMKEALEDFKGLAHRTNWIRSLNGVDWINDSKGTNVGATISAISGLSDGLLGKIVLIAGGQGKGADFTELRDVVVKSVKTIILIGEDAPLIEKALADIVMIIRADSIEQAVLKAKECASPNDLVLLSPACASFDMFRDFNHRGEVFTKLVEKL
jgi:UDP-N-acetylmuramoylalanine--D-glutamate ligase